MSKLNLIIIFILCFVFFTECQLTTKTDESKLVIALNDTVKDSEPQDIKLATVLNDTVKDKKPQNTKYEGLIGFWFMPHVGVINITFYEDETFVFNDYNLKTKEDETFRGTYKLKGDKLILKYNDRPQQIFKYAKGDAIGNYYITKGDYYYFVKGEVDD